MTAPLAVAAAFRLGVEAEPKSDGNQGRENQAPFSRNGRHPPNQT